MRVGAFAGRRGGKKMFIHIYIYIYIYVIYYYFLFTTIPLTASKEAIFSGFLLLDIVIILLFAFLYYVRKEFSRNPLSILICLPFLFFFFHLGPNSFFFFCLKRALCEIFEEAHPCN